VPSASGARRTTTSQKRAAVPRRARIEASWTLVSLEPRLESNKEEERRPRPGRAPSTC
jgi:hypothetical protein